MTHFLTRKNRSKGSENKRAIAGLALALGIGFGVNAEASTLLPLPVLVPAPAEKLFVPLGFDNNDNSEVIVHGHFPNSCFKTGPVNAKVDKKTKKVTLEPTAWLYLSSDCQDLSVPFTQVVQLGTLSEGAYKVSLAGSAPEGLAKLQVSSALRATPDDYLYAPVENADLEINSETGERFLVLSGEDLSSEKGCLKLESVKVSVTPGNVLVVLPIAELAPPETCASQPTKFSHKVKLDDAWKGEFLVHVRVLNGNSLNKLIKLP